MQPARRLRADTRTSGDRRGTVRACGQYDGPSPIVRAARRLNITERTVKVHLGNACRHIGAG
jgi:hypothetical protein